jgi:hypothetical protein
MTIFAATTYAMGIAFLPETYGPLLLQRRVRALQASTSTLPEKPMRYYRSVHDGSEKTATKVLRTSLSRPFIFLFLEPIVVLLSFWVAYVYGMLYLFFAAYPLVFQSPRPLGYGMDAGIGALPFLGIGVGMIAGTCISYFTNKRYVKRMNGSKPPPEARLPPACFGAVCMPVSLAIFAANCNPSTHWIAPTLAGLPFGLGLILTFVSVLSYLIDTFGIHCASALAANAVLRALFGAAFPLFATKMYHGLGFQWASGLLAFLALACTPMSFLFYRYGAQIRSSSRFAPARVEERSGGHV